MKRLRRIPDFVLLLLGLGVMFTLYTVPTTDWTPEPTPTTLPPTFAPITSLIIGDCLTISDTVFPTSTSEVVLPVRVGNPVPYSDTPITAANVLSVTLLAQWGTSSTANIDIAINDIRLRADGRLVAIAGERGVRIREVATGSITCQTTGLYHMVAADFHPTLDRIAIKDNLGNVQIVDLQDPHKATELLKTAHVSALRFLETGSLGMVEQDTQRYAVWQVGSTNVNQLGFISSNPVVDVVSRQTESMKASAEIGATTIRVTSGHPAEHKTLDPEMNQLHADFSPDGTQLAVGGDTGVQLWESATGKLVWASEGQLSGVSAIQFSPNGEWIATTTQNNALLVWNAHDGALLARWDGHVAPLTAVQIAPDATFVLTASMDGSVGVWGIPK